MNRRGLAGERTDDAVVRARAFEQPQRGRANRHDAAAGAPDRIERVRRLRADAAMLAVHAMGGGVGRLDRKEGAGPDMQRHGVERDLPLPQRAIRASVKCSPAVGAATDPSASANIGLIVDAVALVGRPPRRDIGRQRHRAAFIHGLIEHRPVEREGERDLAALAFRLHGRIELAEEADPALLAEAHDVAGREPLCRLDERAPARPVEAQVQRRLDRGLAGAAPDAPAAQPRRDHLAVVDHERVAGAQQIGQVAHGAIRHRRAGTHHEQPRGVPRRDWTQRNPLGRQLEIEQIGTHTSTHFSS